MAAVSFIYNYEILLQMPRFNIIQVLYMFTSFFMSTILKTILLTLLDINTLNRYLQTEFGAKMLFCDVTITRHWFYKHICALIQMLSCKKYSPTFTVY